MPTGRWLAIFVAMSRTMATFVLLAGALACGDASRERVLLVTTHSVEDSGLLELLVSGFQVAHPAYRVAALAVGSGAALEVGRRGDADVLLTHDPVGERRFIEGGHVDRYGPLMSNRFLLVGPPGDPAGLAAASDALAAFGRLAEVGARFVSRGDDSGTHRRERSLWRELGLTPWVERPAWYVEAGLGMAETLRVADQMAAYTLTDGSTFRTVARSVRLDTVPVDDARFENPYTWMIVARSRNPDGARALAEWLAGAAQDIIAEYGTDRHGAPLFRPAPPR